jgi:hypothetical protein
MEKLIMKSKQGRPVVYDKSALLEHAMQLSRSVGYDRVTRSMLATAAGTSESNISRVFGTMAKLRRAIMSAAIAREDLNIIAQGLAANEPKAKAAPSHIKEAAVELLL